MSCTEPNQTQNEDQKIERVEQLQETKSSSDSRKVILFFGNSLTAGYGLDPAESFTTLIQNRIDSLNLPYTVVNAGLSGETTAGGAGRIDWVLNQQVDIFVLELGGNDMLRGLSIDETEKNLRVILDAVGEKKPEAEVVVAGMQAPPNMGADYTRRFENIYREIADEYNAALIPSFLQGVGGIKSLNLPDGIHPNADGQKIVRETVWAVLKDLLE